MVLTERGVLPTDAHIHCGFDGGQGVIKIAISITDQSQSDQNKGRAKYSEVLYMYIN